MSKLNLVLGDLLYSNPDAGVRVLRGSIEPQHLPIALKELTFSGVRSCNQAIQEAMNHASLAHPNIVQIYDCFLEQAPGGLFTANIVTELMDRDLNQEIESRRGVGTFWTEPELFVCMQALISALSFAERRGISHRDLKPQNIFTSQSTFKIGDFGSSSRNYATSAARRKTLQGSPFFLSPELKQAYIESLSAGQVNLNYDPVKSDVYSLGLTILFMARLAPPGELMDLRRLGEVTRNVIEGLDRYPELKQWLKVMLEERPEDRPSFEEMEKMLLEGSNSEDDHPQGQVEERKDALPAVLAPESAIARTGNEGVLALPAQKEIRRERAKVCTVCSEALRSEEWIGCLPGYLQGYRVFAESCCSVLCLESFSGVFKASNCPSCRRTFLPTDSTLKPLYCGHTMHSLCWTEFLSANPNKFRPGVMNCPCCHIETRYDKKPGN